MALHAAAQDAPSRSDDDGIRVVWVEGVAAFALIALALALTFASVLRATDGVFAYMLDDPYIHLSMAEQILRGEYGINPGEPAAAASSILYPYLLAALMALGAGSFAPFLVNVAALAGLVTAVAGLLREIAGPPATPGRIAQRALVIAAICMALNSVALAFSGMENGPHTALTVAGLWGAVRLQRTGAPPAWWLAVLAVTPLVRYEGVGLLLSGAALLWLNRRPLTALAVASGSLACVGAFSAYLHSLGLPLVPSSVLVKSEETIHTGSSGFIGGVLGHLADHLATPDGMILAASAAFFACHLVRDAATKPRFWCGLRFQIALLGIVATAGHLVLGRYQSFNRYSVYALALGLLCVMVIEARTTRAILSEGGFGATAAVALGLVFLFPANIAQSMMVGACAANIHFQQYQTHRFATEFWKAPIAVNDIGWPSYRNESYVLDLWGLGSEKARQTRRLANPAEGLAALAEEKGVRVAAIYDHWFLTRPSAWVAVGRLKLDVPLVSADGDTVTFYATRADHAPALRAALDAFARTLPRGASLRLE